jgi:hypothetical protein
LDVKYISFFVLVYYDPCSGQFDATYHLVDL